MKKKFFIIGIILIIIGGGLYYYFFRLHHVYKDDLIITADADSLVQVEIFNDFGIPADSFDVVDGRIRRNQNIALIFRDFGLEDSVKSVVKASEGVFNLRKIRMGKEYHFYFEKDSAKKVRYFVYEHSDLEYFRVDFKDSVEVIYGQRYTDTIKKTSQAVISKSLWKTMKANDINPLLANELSEIYAWSINFFGLQKGDSFKVIYDEVYIQDTVSIGISKIYAAFFYHSDHDFFAIPFEQDSVLSFFDENGNSLKKAFLKAPLKYSRISSGFSYSRYHPILHIWRPHHGVDYAAASGTPVHAIGDGKVLKTAWDRGGGWFVKIKHNSVYTTLYMHLSGFAKGIKPGVYVKQGTLIGYVGMTGMATGPHLDFRLYKNGYAINPLTYEAPPVEPIKEENKAAFDSVKNVVISKWLEMEIPTVE